MVTAPVQFNAFMAVARCVPRGISRVFLALRSTDRRDQ